VENVAGMANNIWFPIGTPSTHLEEYLEDATGLLVDKAGNTLDAATAGQAANGRLGDSLDVVTKHLPARPGRTREGGSKRAPSLAGECRRNERRQLSVPAAGPATGRTQRRTCGAWLLPCPGPCRPCRVQTWCRESKWSGECRCARQSVFKRTSDCSMRDQRLLCGRRVGPVRFAKPAVSCASWGDSWVWIQIESNNFASCLSLACSNANAARQFTILV